MSLPKRIFRRFKKIYNSFRNTVYLSVSTKIGTKYTRKPLQLAIFDDQYPSIISQFRVLEYEKYLSKYNAHIFSTNPYFNNLRQQYLKYYPTSESKIHPFKGLAVKADLAYFIFVNNGVDFIGFIEKNKLPFVFTCNS